MSFQKICALSLISLGTLVLILGIYVLYADSLFDKSCDVWIPNIQERHAGHEDGEVWTIVSKLSVFSLSNGPLVFILANQKSRAYAFYFVAAFVSQAYLISLLQLVFHRPAPFWVKLEIDTYECQASFAAPASSSQLAWTILLIIWSTVAFDPNKGCKPLTKILTLLICLGFPCAISYGHMFNGDTGLD